LINETIKKYGKINFLISNAAVATKMGNFLKEVEQQIDNVWNVNFKSTFFLVQ
jgi:NAD(P)-dependent dehydrogenase (short-subunit alcohol dehydrogenase family)